MWQKTIIGFYNEKKSDKNYESNGNLKQLSESVCFWDSNNFSFYELYIWMYNAFNCKYHIPKSAFKISHLTIAVFEWSMDVKICQTVISGLHF
jgi:hypothetical protein